MATVQHKETDMMTTVQPTRTDDAPTLHVQYHIETGRDEYGIPWRRLGDVRSCTAQPVAGVTYDTPYLMTVHDDRGERVEPSDRIRTLWAQGYRPMRLHLDDHIEPVAVMGRNGAPARACVREHTATADKCKWWQRDPTHAPQWYLWTRPSYRYGDLYCWPYGSRMRHEEAEWLELAIDHWSDQHVYESG